MDFEEYEERIRSLPVEQLHTFVEEDPEMAIAWAMADEARADAWAEAHGVELDEQAKVELLVRLMGWIKQNGRQSQGKG